MEFREPVTIEIEMAGKAASLMVEIQDEVRVQRIVVSAVPIVIGSGRSANVVVEDRTVSSQHCLIVAERGGITVRDLGSRNGTYVGGARVQEAWVREGATIIVGRTSIMCVGTGHEDEELGPPLAGVAGASVAMCRVATQVRRLARLSAPVLVTGETGVGKELVARALHAEGSRNEGPFVALNVAALPRELVESELFGHERGAFTGAVTRRAGAFVEASGGTLFLDEIGELPLDSQPKLLRALDGYEVRRVGGSGEGRKSDARVVAATHAPLFDHVKVGTFRRDLFHRLEVFVVELPPLRQRLGDVLPIARFLLEQMAGEIGERALTPSAVAQLMAHDWPGNVRELRNVLCRAADLATQGRFIDNVAVARALRRTLGGEDERPPVDLTPESAQKWLQTYKGNISAAARAARMPRTTFRKLLEKSEG